MNGRVLHFYLAGINNQNFIMRDRETGSWWQQVTGKAIYGPLKGTALNLVPSDELTMGEWRSEISNGKVLAPVPKYNKKYDSNWEPEVAKLPVVISFPGTELKPRDLVVGLDINGTSRAYPWEALRKQSPVIDRVNGTPILVALGPDGKSLRAFVSRIDGKDSEFFLQGEADMPPPNASARGKLFTSGNTSKSDASGQSLQQPDTSLRKPWVLLDTTTASEWNFQGCAIAGPATGKCLDRIPALKDYWFDWRNYHPNTTIYKH